MGGFAVFKTFKIRLFQAKFFDQKFTRLYGFAQLVKTVYDLQDFGLVKTLEKIVERYNVTGSIQIEMKVTRFSGGIDRSLEFIIYRTIIELINNTIKHARAKTACIELITGHAVIRLKYMDNGIGFDLQQILLAEKGIGLIAIIQRIRLIQGKYKFKHIPDKGIEFEFRFPLK